MIPFHSLLHRILTQLGFIAPNEQQISTITITARLKVVLAAFFALFVVAYVSYSLLNQTTYIFLLASMGASAVIIFALPSSPLARPWAFIAGHFIPAGIGLFCSLHIEQVPLMAATTIAAVIFSMYLFECMHPPGGATALVPVISAASGHTLGWEFLIFPVGLNILLMGFASFLLRRFLIKVAPPALTQVQALQSTEPPRTRLSIQQEDMNFAMNSLDSVLDVNTDILMSLYQKAQMHAFDRQQGKLICQQIMSKHLLSLQSHTAISEAWTLLQDNKISMLPVVSDIGSLIGVVSLVDFIKNTKQPFKTGVLGYFSAVRSRLKSQVYQRNSVNTIMTTEVITVMSDDPISLLVPLFTQQGLHHVPVVDSNSKLVGIITQSDFIAALIDQHARNAINEQIG